MPELVYERIPNLTESEISRAVERNDPDELLIAVLSASLYNKDRVFAERLCIRLAEHADFNVRRNALLGLAHIVRIDGKLDETKVSL